MDDLKKAYADAVYAGDVDAAKAARANLAEKVGDPEHPNRLHKNVLRDIRKQAPRYPKPPHKHPETLADQLRRIEDKLG